VELLLLVRSGRLACASPDDRCSSDAGVSSHDMSRSLSWGSGALVDRCRASLALAAGRYAPGRAHNRVPHP
jgi:hypothetical protein